MLTAALSCSEWALSRIVSTKLVARARKLTSSSSQLSRSRPLRR